MKLLEITWNKKIIEKTLLKNISRKGLGVSLQQFYRSCYVMSSLQFGKKILMIKKTIFTM